LIKRGFQESFIAKRFVINKFVFRRDLTRRLFNTVANVFVYRFTHGRFPRFCTQSMSSLVTSEEQHQSALHVRRLAETPPIYVKTPMFTNVKTDMRMDFSRMLEKPFHLATKTWASTDNAQTMIFELGFPSSVVSLNKLASAAFDLASLYHLKACFVVQVAGTPMHSGALIASVVPKGVQNTVPNGPGGVHQMQTAPHAFLHANSSNAVCIEIPWYSSTKLRYTPSVNDNVDELTLNGYTTSNNSDYASLSVRVISPLGFPSSANSSLNITIAVVFKELNFFVPKNTFVTQSKATELVSRGLDTFASAAKVFTGDIIDTGRTWIRSMTGLHNPNIRNPQGRHVMALRNNPNYVDRETYLYKLDPYAEHVTPLDEFHSDTDVDEGLISNLCGKNMLVSVVNVATSAVAGTLLFSAPISPLMFRATVGSTTLVTAPIDKLARLARFWSGDLILTLHNYGSAFHMYKLLVVREYMSSVQQLAANPVMTSVTNNPCDIVEFSSGGQSYSVTLPMASMFDQIPISPSPADNCLVHGRVSIYLLQPLVTNGSVVNNIDFGVHLRAGEDFALYGYANEYFTTQSAAMEVPVNISDDTAVVTPHSTTNVPTVKNFRPIVHVRDLTRRMYPVGSINVVPADIIAKKGIFTLNLRSFLCGFGGPVTPMDVVGSLFFGFRGGLKVKLLIRGAPDAVVKYYPPMPCVADVGSAFANNNQYRYKIAGPSNATLPALISAQNDRNSAFTTFTSGAYFGPVLESADFRIPAGSLDTAGVSTTEQPSDFLAATCTHEFEVPWMNACRFAQLFNTTTAGSDVNYQSYQDSLGYITIGLLSMYDNDISAGTSGLANVNIQVFLGVDDTARYLYQTMSRPLKVPTLGTGAFPATVADTSYTSIYGGLNNTTNDYPALPATQAATYFVGPPG